MHVNSHHLDSKLFSALFAATTLLLTVGPAAWRTIADLDRLATRISLELCEIGLAVLRVCGI
jgi:hypothetical protein